MSERNHKNINQFMKLATRYSHLNPIPLTYELLEQVIELFSLTFYSDTLFSSQITFNVEKIYILFFAKQSIFSVQSGYTVNATKG